MAQIRGRSTPLWVLVVLALLLTPVTATANPFAPPTAAEPVEASLVDWASAWVLQTQSDLRRRLTKVLHELDETPTARTTAALIIASFLNVAPFQKGAVWGVPAASVGPHGLVGNECGSIADDINGPTPQARIHTVEPGDTLSRIFSHYQVGHDTLNAILLADQELLALDILRPGNRLQFIWDGCSGKLKTVSLSIDPARTIHYQRVTDDLFEFEEEILPTHWRERVLTAEIRGSFYASASRVGLDDGEILRVERILEERVDFRRELRAGDRFEIVVAKEMVAAGPTGQTRIEGLRLQLGRRVESAFLHEDGKYYDAHGESLTRAFLRYPMQGNYRVSSPFDLRRVHPVTGRVAPHHGVDFAMPTGTPVLTTGDGVVTRVGNHVFAGKYIEIEHPGPFKTRYLHLSRILVDRGQRVRRGERIALSGNTGRSTGPHLHFELHVNGRPIDPLKAELPTAARIPDEDRPAFFSRVEALQATMNGATQLALRTDPKD